MDRTAEEGSPPLDGTDKPGGDAPRRYRIRAPAGDPRGRRATLLIVDYMTRAYNTRRRLYDDDHELMMIADAVDLHTVAGQAATIGDPMPGCTAKWIARTTQLPRETVRRKLWQLVKRGFLERHPDGQFGYRQGVVSESFRAVLGRLEAETVDFFNRCLDDGVFEIVVEKDAPQNGDR